MQNRKRDTDVQNRLLDSVGEGVVGCFEGIFDFTSSLRCTLMFYAFFWACVLNSKDILISFVFHGVMLSILYVC